MKIVMAFFLTLALITSVWAVEPVTFENYLKSFDYEERSAMKIGIPQMLQLYQQGKVQIVDIRFSEEHQVYRFGFIKYIPLNEPPDRLGELDKTKIIVTVCPHYDRVEIARINRTLQGYRSQYLADGLLGLADYLRGDRARDFTRGVY